MSKSNSVKDIEKAVKHCYSTWSEDYFDNYYGSNAPYPPVHCDLLKKLIRKSKAKSVLDAGCGPASFLRELSGKKIARYGFDLTPEMVQEGSRIFDSQGDSPDRIWQGSVLSKSAFRSPVEPKKRFESAVCIGVIPHIPEGKDAQVFRNLHSCVKKNGLVIVEARNKFFSLFTLNRYTEDFFLNELIQSEELRKSRKNGAKKMFKALSELKKLLRVDLPPVRKGKKKEPGYDEVLSRTHNPLETKALFEKQGFKDVEILYYHYHSVPPMFAAADPKFFLESSLELEDPYDWRGLFMASAFLVAGRRA